MRRRDFLKQSGLAGLGWAATSAGILARPQTARAAGTGLWGDYPDFAASALLPPEQRAKNVLEIFLYGGLSPWETLYTVTEPEFGESAGLMWFTYLNQIEERFGQCFSDSAPLTQDFALDGNGTPVKLGPFALRLRNRPDVVDRMRLHVVTHTLEPHEGAIPLAMSGFRLGAPKLAGVGAAVQHYFQEHEEFTGEPWSYVLYSPGDFPTDNLRAASSVGQHPGSTRPLSIKVTPSTAFIEALDRSEVGELRPKFDALLDHYASDYRDRLRFAGAGNPVRSATMADYDFALGTIKKTDNLKAIFSPDFFQSIPGKFCGGLETASNNFPRMNLELARHLLTRPDSKARHVTVVDAGLIPANGGGGYDTHADHIQDMSRNFDNLLEHLMAIINVPGEGDPTKLDLDETMIVFNTEFGRTPGVQGTTGRNHHPYAYVTAMFGGPVGSAQKGIVGAIGPDGYATSALSPAETRAATLAALGIYPFAPECYAVSDVAGAGNETEGALWVKEEVLGVKS